jgi:hypothetical protein
MAFSYTDYQINNSTHVAKIRYDSVNLQLIVEYKNGTIGHFTGVPQSVVTGMLQGGGIYDEIQDDVVPSWTQTFGGQV